MTVRSGSVYECRVFVSPDSVADFEAWAEERTGDAIAGVAEVNRFAIDPDKEGRQGQAFQYHFENDEALEDFLDGPATEMEAQALDRFEDRIVWLERVLREDSSTELPSGEMPQCLNCGTHLRGQYCGHCGQRARNRLISLWELLREAFGDLFELDSRLWKTIVPLLSRPGLLTHDYLQGRRARYMPPFRMYLVLSLLFFLVAFFNPRETFSLFYDPQTLAEAEEEERRLAAETGEKVRDELAAEGIVVGDGELSEELKEHLEDDLDAGFNIHIGDENSTGEEDCNVEDFEIDGPEWFKRRLTPERVQRVCEQVRRDGGRQFVANLVDNIPIALIVLLPIMAFVLKALYPLSRRYYVEHLLFFVHFHAFFFLILTLQIIVARSYAVLPIPDAIGVLVIIAASFYVPVYLFVAMRKVYGQGRAITALKYVVLSISYLAGFTVTMLGAVTMAALAT
jgi:hypothetical protein